MTSLKFLQFLKDKIETPYVVSYFFNRLPGAAPEGSISRRNHAALRLKTSKATSPSGEAPER